MPKTSASHPPYIYLATLFWAVPISRFVLYCILHFTLPTGSVGLRAGGFCARHRRASHATPRLCLAQNYDPQRHGMTQGLHSVSELKVPGVRPRECLQHGACACSPLRRHTAVLCVNRVVCLPKTLCVLYIMLYYNTAFNIYNSNYHIY